MASLDILSITCVKKQDRNPKDEVSLYIDGTKVFGPEKMANGDVVVPPISNQSFNGNVGVELFEEDNGVPNGLRLGGFTIPDSLATLPGNVDHFGVFDDELPGAFYYMEYHVIP